MSPVFFWHSSLSFIRLVWENGSSGVNHMHDNILWSERHYYPGLHSIPIFFLSSFSDSKVNFAQFLLLMQFNCNGDTSFSDLYAMLFFSYANTLYAWMCMRKKSGTNKWMTSRAFYLLFQQIFRIVIWLKLWRFSF